MGKTKKVGSTGRYGRRYGSTLRKRILAVEKVQKRAHNCPACASQKVSRESVGIWHCRFCGHKFAGGAYTPKTDVGSVAVNTSNRIRAAREALTKK
ncbi:MAG: 50S ribosomal protein L37ae [Candidatus Hodarchaeales archaeon]|jgi:large subunit ribosomal protein L37Ae